MIRTVILLFLLTLLLQASSGNIFKYKKYVDELSTSIKASNKKLPKQIDKMTRLLIVKNDNLDLTYFYSLDYSKIDFKEKNLDDVMWPKDRKAFEKQFIATQGQFNTASSCVTEFLKGLIDKGGSVGYKYFWKDSHESFLITVSQKDCDELALATKEASKDIESFNSTLKFSINLYKKMLPYTLNSLVSISKADFNKKTLFYEYTVNLKQTSLNVQKITKKPMTMRNKAEVTKSYINTIRGKTISSTCGNENTKKMLMMGNIMKVSYVWDDGKPIVTESISIKDCPATK